MNKMSKLQQLIVSANVGDGEIVLGGAVRDMNNKRIKSLFFNVRPYDPYGNAKMLGVGVVIGSGISIALCKAYESSEVKILLDAILHPCPIKACEEAPLRSQYKVKKLVTDNSHEAYVNNMNSQSFIVHKARTSSISNNENFNKSGIA